VPDFNAGAMENPGCVTLRDQYIYRGRATRAERASRAGTVAHEMAHMWFGDLVTMRWWDDLWMNESFAEYAAHRCCSDGTRYPLWTEFGIVRKDWGSVADQGPSTHPVAGNGAPDAEAALQDFDGISYAKGAAVLKQLVAYLGDETFLTGLRDYFDKHAYGNATLADLLAAWQRAGATDLDRWAEDWLQTSGLDTLSIAGGALVRAAPPGSSVERSHTLSVAALDDTGAETDRRLVTLTTPRLELDLDSGSALLVPDADDVTWARIRLGASWPEVTTLMPTIAQAATRVVVINAVRDAVRSAEIDPEQAMRGLLEVARDDAEDVVVGSVLRFCTEALAATYTPVDRRASQVALVHRTASGVVDRAAAGSDRQLLGFRYAIGTSADVGQLLSWLEGSSLPPGLPLDPELSWSVVVRLAELGGDPVVIDRALDRDPSAAGRVHAARARASMPSAEAKEAAWSALTEPSELPASELYAVARGFFRPSQSELTAAYVPRFFAEMPATASFRSGWSLGQVVSDAFPTSHSSRQTLALAEAALERDLPAAVRRSMTDGTDTVRRAVASLERFG
jgi:aminopeptidase N